MAISNASSGLRPGVCTSTTRPQAPFEGQLIYETDTNRVLVWDNADWVYPLTGKTTLPGSYVSYTPTWTNLTVGNGTQSFNYMAINNFIHVQGIITLGSTTSISGGVSMSYPSGITGAGGNGEPIGFVRFNDSGTGQSFGVVLQSGTASVVALQVYNAAGTYLTNNTLSSTVPFTWAVNDSILVNFSTRIS